MYANKKGNIKVSVILEDFTTTSAGQQKEQQEVVRLADITVAVISENLSRTNTCPNKRERVADS